MKSKFCLLVLLLVGCTDTDRAQWLAYGSPGQIDCYSGGQKIYSGKSTGKIQTVAQSDGWEFKEAGSGNLLRVSGDCIIRN